MDALNAAIYAKLDAHVGLAALLSADAVNVFAGEADDSATLPYVVFTKADGRPDLTFGNFVSSREYVYFVVGYARASASKTGKEIASLIAAQIVAALHDAALTVSGFSALNCAWVGDIPPRSEKNLTDRALDTCSEGARFRITLA